MKTRLLHLLLFSVISLVTIAQDYGRITIKNAANDSPTFIVSLNGVRVSNTYSTSVTFRYADETLYRIKILQSGSSQLLRFNLNNEIKYNSVYLLSRDNAGRYSLLLQSKSLMLTDNDDDLVQTNTVTTNPSTVIAMEPMPEPVVTKPKAMSETVFKQKYEEVKAQSFDNDKIERIKEAFEYEFFTTNQVISLMKLFSFDDKKVEAAKFAYPQTLDHENFYKTYDQLSFGSAKTELKTWINEHKND